MLSVAIVGLRGRPSRARTWIISILRRGWPAPNALRRSILTVRLLPLLQLLEQIAPRHGDFRNLEQLLDEFSDGGLRLPYAFDFAGQAPQPVGRLDADAARIVGER